MEHSPLFAADIPLLSRSLSVALSISHAFSAQKRKHPNSQKRASVSVVSVIATVKWWLNTINGGYGETNAATSHRAPSHVARSVAAAADSHRWRSPDCLVVRWLRPQGGWVKINVDGSSLGNPGNSGGGGVCRDDKGDFRFAFSAGYGLGSNVNAELRAILDGIDMCIGKGFQNVIVESDSKLVINFLTCAATPGWKWGYWIQRIKCIRRFGNFRFSHIYREGNAVADQMARIGSAEQGNRLFLQQSTLPAKVRGLLFLDKVGLGSIRERTRAERDRG